MPNGCDYFFHYFAKETIRKMKLKEVVSESEKKIFLEVPLTIYQTDDQWIRPLDKDINEVFDSKKNKFYRHGEAIRWILLDEKNKAIGRVAAFVNRKTSNTFSQPTGGLGFFECVNNREAAIMLFDACKQWNASKGMEAMDGPINFGEKDRWWGLLVDGFFEPTYCSNYQPRYYQQFFEEYGFKVYFEQYNYLFKVKDTIPEKYRERADKIAKDPLYHCEHINKKQLEKYAEDFRTIYNSAWKRHDNFKGMTKEQSMSVMKTIKPVMENELIWFAYYDKKPVGFFIMLPELNKIFKYLNGKFDLTAKLKFLYYRWRGVCRKMYGVAFGIVPDHQSKGVEGFIIMAAAKKIQAMNKYDDFEMTWIGDFNPKMINLVEAVGAKKVRTYYTYRKLFDDTKEFKRAPSID